ncbi:MAG TPA: sugar transferase [Terriglobia bacterium]|nr:sugar transferase [Terriglobia bacterium]
MAKRAFDIFLSGFGLIWSSPLWALIALAIKLDDGGPIFYRQIRVGKGNREFVSFKFRSMRADSDKKWGAIPASEKDPRITRVGCLLRATAMDELPQLWNILRGDMSFVGPRPEWVELVKQFRKEVSGFDMRHAVRPGLTGFAQVYGDSELPRRQKLRYDRLYIKRQSLWIDLRLIALSFLVTFMGGWEVRASKVPPWLGKRVRAQAQRPMGQSASAGALSLARQKSIERGQNQWPPS